MANVDRISRLRLTALMTLCVIAIASPGVSETARSELDAIMREAPRSDIARLRSSCALGQASATLSRMRAVAADRLPAAGAWCVTVLTRAGRDGTLGYVRDPSINRLTASLAFDGGFVGGYRGGNIPAGAPTLANLLPTADRCLGQIEPDTDLCNAVGQILGARAARGEVIATR